MPKAKNLRILFDYSHGEILNLNDSEYKSFRELLKSMECVIFSNDSDRISPELLQNVDVLVLGCPVESYLISSEISAIIDFVSTGNSLLVISEVGVLQKTNVNDLMKHFGVYFENTAVRSQKSLETNSIIMITDIIDHSITKNVKKIMFGGCSTIRTVKAKGSMDVCLSGEDTWVEVYDEIHNTWKKNSDIHVPVVSVSIFGQGRIAAITDVDLFGSNPLYGLDSLDNKQLIQNLILWFHTPVQSGATIDWLLSQFSQMREEILEIEDKFDNLVTTTRILENRISQLEARQDIFQLELNKVIQKTPETSTSSSNEYVSETSMSKKTEKSMEK